MDKVANPSSVTNDLTVIYYTILYYEEGAISYIRLYLLMYSFIVVCAC